MKNLQDQVKSFSEETGLEETPIWARLMDLSSELGEVAKAYLVGSSYGTKELRDTGYIKEELGDVMFSLIMLANSMSIDLQECLEHVLDKYRRRIKDSGRIGS